MGIEEMEAGIIKEAEDKAQAIHKKAQDARRIIFEEQKKRIELEKAGIKSRFEQNMLQMETKEMASARMEAKKQVLKEKERLIDSVYRNFFSELDKEVSSEELLESLFKLGRSGLKSVENVYVNKKDAEIAKKFRVDVKTTNIRGGLILESGNESIDMSIEVLENLLRQRTIKEVSRKMFGD